ncbi:MAG: hypothetical protein M3238_08050 [Actinomycetota bacterium]|nr:hypothetical protein [Actinomycetota bacterium]
MKRLLALSAAVLMLLAPGARAGVDGVGPGYFASDNVEYVGYVPLENDTSGARLVGKFLYITTSRSLTIYDLSDPVSPKRLGTAVLPQDPYFAEEDVDTNGKILLIGSLGTLHVLDVEDKSNPKVIGELDGADQHTISCVLDCTYAYGSGGVIVDLRNPTKPKEVGNWAEGSPAGGGGHDVTEVAPGLVLTSTQPLMLLDARKDPAHPKLLATGSNQDGRFIHSNLWPDRARDRFALVGGETGGPTCGENDGAFMTWDTRNWRKTGRFQMVDEYRVKNGLYTDGDSPANLFCMHWFDEHPRYDDGGLVAVAWYEHGTRLLEVTNTGKIKPAGYFIPFGGSTSAAYWVTNEIIYTADYNRGIDIIRVKG